MKIILISKKSLLIALFILLTAILTAFLILRGFSKEKAVELTYNCKVSNEFMEKVINLTDDKSGGQKKIAYLTFDDGPTASVTPKVLDILESENVKATFFVIGKSVEEHPEIVKRAYEEGHYIANHGYDHNNSVLYKNSESFANEIKKTDCAISEAIGVENYCAHIFRFPNGFVTPIYQEEKKNALSILSEMNYAYIDWNCLNNDSVAKCSDGQLLNNLKQSAENKNTIVILMHDTNDVNDSSTVLKESIDYLKSQGYEFKNFYTLF